MSNDISSSQNQLKSLLLAPITFLSFLVGQWNLLFLADFIEVSHVCISASRNLISLYFRLVACQTVSCRVVSIIIG